MKTKPKAELQKLAKDARERLRSLHFDLEAGKVKNVAELRKLKKDVARILTFLNYG